MPTLPTPDDAPENPLGRELSEDETALFAAFTPPEDPSEDAPTEVTGGAPDAGSPAVAEGASPPEPAVEPPAEAPVAPAEPTVDFLGEQISEQQAQYLATVGTWYAGLSDEQRTAIDTYTRTGQLPQPTADPTVAAAAPAVEPQPAPTLTDEQLERLDPDTAAVVRAQQQQFTHLQAQLAEQLQPLTQTVEQLRQQQAQTAQQQQVALAEEVTDAFMAAHGIDPAEKFALTTAAVPHAQVLQAQGVTDMRTVFDRALTNAYYTDDKFRAQAIVAEAQKIADTQVAETLETRKKAAKSGALAGSAASVARDMPTGPMSREDKDRALVSAVRDAMNNGQSN